MQNANRINAKCTFRARARNVRWPFLRLVGPALLLSARLIHSSHLALLVVLIRAVGEALLDARPPGHLEARPAIYIHG